MSRIALVDDDRNILTSVSMTLEAEGFEVETYNDGQAALDAFNKRLPDMAVFDIKMPRMDGMDLLQRVRQKTNMPVIFLTSKDDEIDEVLGLRMGADDYVKKPFSQRLLVERIRALLRRSDISRPLVLALADLTLDPVSHQATRAGAPLVLTPKEYAILLILLRQAGEVVSRARLAEQIWQADLIGIDNLIDVHVRNLRGKVDAPGLPALIHTVRGRGFRLADNDGG